MATKTTKTEAPPAPATDVSVTQERAVPAFTEAGVRALMAELCAARAARVMRSYVLSGTVDGTKVGFFLPDKDELDRLTQFAAQVASVERGACLDVAEAVVGKEQRETLANAFVKRGPLGFTMRVEWTPDAKVWLAK